MALQNCQRSFPRFSPLSRAFLSPSKQLRSMIPPPSASSHPSKSVECSLDPLDRKKNDALHATRDISGNGALRSSVRGDNESVSFVFVSGEV